MIERAAECGTCAFFLASDDAADDTGVATAVGICRRYPPVKPADDDLALFPYIWDWTLWCGEWKENTE